MSNPIIKNGQGGFIPNIENMEYLYSKCERLEAENKELRERIKEAMAYIRLCHPIKYKEWLSEAEQALKDKQ